MARRSIPTANRSGRRVESELLARLGEPSSDSGFDVPPVTCPQHRRTRRTEPRASPVLWTSSSLRLRRSAQHQHVGWHRFAIGAGDRVADTSTPVMPAAAIRSRATRTLWSDSTSSACTWPSEDHDADYVVALPCAGTDDPDHAGSAWSIASLRCLFRDQRCRGLGSS